MTLRQEVVGFTFHGWEPLPDGYELHLKRIQFTALTTIGELWLGDWMECFTLEDCVRKVKIPKCTAIPAGRYQIVVTPSTRFKRDLPLLLDVPGFEGVRIHPGNTDKDTDGCIMPGRTRGVDFVGESVLAFNGLFLTIKEVLKTEHKLFIRITDDFQAVFDDRRKTIRRQVP